MMFEDVKQEPEAATSTSNPVQPPPMFSSAVTTGQGGPYNSHWLATSVSSKYGTGRLGNKRAPIPTCGIPVTRASSSISVAPVCEVDRRPACAKTADIILGLEEGPAVPTSDPNSTGSGSLESTQDRELPRSEEGSLERSDESEASEQEEEDEKSHDLRRSTRSHQKPPTRKYKEKKKVGRPIAYKGDPNAPELTEQERRRIKRRIANRESARRVRHKRQEILEEMQVKMEQIQAHNDQLLRHAKEIDGQKSSMLSQMADLERKLEKTTTENMQMQQEIQALRQSLQLKMSALEVELDKRASEADTPMSAGYCAMEQSGFPVPLQVSQPPACTQQSYMEPKVSMEFKGPLEWFPSLNLDDLPSHAESLDMLNSILHDDQPMSNSQPTGAAVC